MFDLLENAGATCRSVVTNGGNTLLHWFCFNKANDEHMSLLKKLIKKGCDVNAQNNLLHTPLMLAAKLNMINTCHILLNASADMNIVDHQGNQAIDLAIQGSECFKLLKRAKHTNYKHNHNTDGVIWKKQINYTRSLAKQMNEPIPSLYNDEIKIKRYSANALENYMCNETDREELDTKYKRMWEKLLQTKQKIRRRDTSLQKSRERSQSRKRDLSQQRPSDLCQKDSTIVVKL
jgi:ankyrin repeat protein